MLVCVKYNTCLLSEIGPLRFIGFLPKIMEMAKS